MRVVVLVLGGVFDTGLAAVLDSFALADELVAAGVAPGPRPMVEVCGVRARVRTQLGLRVPVGELGGARPEVVIVPALGCKQPAGIAEALERPDARDAMARLRELAAGGATVAAACTGTYVLARSGLLDGKRATTSWWLGPDFRARFPQVEVDDTQMVVAEGGCVTAGAALAHVDLALWLIRQRSPTLAATTARYLLSDQRSSQAAYAIVDQFAHGDPMVQRFERWTRAHLASFSMSAAARAVGTTERTLQRRVRRVLGRTPIGYVQDLRVARAIHLLQTTDDSFEAIAEAVGYQEATTLRTLLRRRTGRGVRELLGR